MRVVLVSGIWPPDVGGPSSHAPALAAALLEAGHEVEVVTTADVAPESRPYPVRWVARSRPAPLRHLAVVREVASAARDADRMAGRRELSPLEQLETLEELRQRGVISQAEFDLKKQKLLDRL